MKEGNVVTLRDLLNHPIDESIRYGVYLLYEALDVIRINNEKASDLLEWLLLKFENVNLMPLLSKIDDLVLASLQTFNENLKQSISGICTYHDKHRQQYQSEAKILLDNGDLLNEDERELLKFAGVSNLNELESLQELNDDEKELLNFVINYAPGEVQTHQSGQCYKSSGI